MGCINLIVIILINEPNNNADDYRDNCTTDGVIIGLTVVTGGRVGLRWNPYDSVSFETLQSFR